MGPTSTSTPVIYKIFNVRTNTNNSNNNSSDIDDFIKELLVEDPTLERALKEGRKWTAEVLYEKYPESLRALRLRAGYSQSQLSQKIGMKQPNICEFELGKRKPNSDTLLRLADALGTTVDVVLKSLNCHSE